MGCCDFWHFNINLPRWKIKCQGETERWKRIHVWVFAGRLISKYRCKPKPQSPYVGSECSKGLIAMHGRVVSKAWILKWLCVGIQTATMPFQSPDSSGKKLRSAVDQRATIDSSEMLPCLPIHVSKTKITKWKDQCFLT